MSIGLHVIIPWGLCLSDHLLPAPTLGVVGGQETQGFLDQTRNFSTALQASGHIAQTLVAEHLDHFSVCQAISDPDSALFHRVNAFIDAQLGN